MQKIPMTKYGIERLQKELEELKNNVRPRIIKAIAEAREHGDLKENAEYHAAREQQGFTEGRIKEIEHKLSFAQIIDISKIENDGKVIFGSTVTLLNEDTKLTAVYQIVGDDEANVKENKISINTPIARAIVGKHEGDTVTVQAPNSITKYTIELVEYV